MKSRRLSKAPTRETNRPTRATAENAVRTLIQWAGDDPDREGLRGTPARVVRAYEEWFAGYFEDPREYLQRTFEEVAGYDEMVLLRDIRFESHCEHHIAPIIGHVHIGYLPRKRIVGISKLVRLIDVYAKRMQVQEKMTAEIAACLDGVLKPHGVAVVVEGVHVVPGGVHPRTRERCVLVEALVVVGDKDLHRGHFSARPGTRPAERYLASFEDIRRLQDHLWERARSEGVAVIDNENVDDTLAQLMQLVLDAVQEVQ